jgi:hypothetical protein
MKWKAVRSGPSSHAGDQAALALAGLGRDGHVPAPWQHLGNAASDLGNLGRAADKALDAVGKDGGRLMAREELLQHRGGGIKRLREGDRQVRDSATCSSVNRDGAMADVVLLTKREGGRTRPQRGRLTPQKLVGHLAKACGIGQRPHGPEYINEKMARIAHSGARRRLDRGPESTMDRCLTQEMGIGVVARLRLVA